MEQQQVSPSGTVPVVQPAPVTRLVGKRLYVQRGEPLDWRSALAAEKALKSQGLQVKLVKETSGTKRLFTPFVFADAKPAANQQGALLETGGKLRQQRKRSVMPGNPWTW